MTPKQHIDQLAFAVIVASKHLDSIIDKHEKDGKELTPTRLVELYTAQCKYDKLERELHEAIKESLEDK